MSFDEDLLARAAGIRLLLRIDILVNNAGIIRRGTIDTVSEEDWDRVIEVNLKGTFNFCKAVAGIMKQQGYGKIVNVSSIAGKMGDITSPQDMDPRRLEWLRRQKPWQDNWLHTGLMSTEWHPMPLKRR